MIAYVGSSDFDVPWPKIESPGSKWSRASACSSFADPVTPIKTENEDVANSPSRMMTPEILVSCMILVLLMNDSRVILAAMAKITTA